MGALPLTHNDPTFIRSSGGRRLVRASLKRVHRVEVFVGTILGIRTEEETVVPVSATAFTDDVPTSMPTARGKW